MRDYKFGHDAARASPEYLRSIGEPIGAAITTGNIGKLATAAAEARQLFAKFDDTLADLDRRLAKLEESPVALARRPAV
jgi:hypothetical protein